MNPDTPVIIGVSQIQQRVTDPLEGKEPIDQMVDAVRAAAVDAGNPGLLSRVDSVRVVSGMWRYKQPAGYVAELVGCAGTDKVMPCEAEMAREIFMPIQMYPIFENAIRHANGETIEQHLKRVSELWSRFSQVAAGNPDAWLRDAVDAETIRTAGPSNRMVSFPYPKLMNSNNAVDMAAAIIICSARKAKSLGIREDRWFTPGLARMRMTPTMFLNETTFTHPPRSGLPAVVLLNSQAWA